MIRILLIDDDILVLEALKLLLEKKGFQVTTATDGPEAFEIASRQEFDIVITDVFMKKMHGVEVIMHFRKHHPKIKIIAVSGGGWASSEFHLNSTRLFGADGYLMKPIPMDVLLGEIRRVMK